MLRWPRSTLLVAAGYAVATAIWYVERSRDRLRTTSDVEATVSSDPNEPQLVEV